MFLDRDGTLIADAHYLSDPERVVILPGTREALCALNAAGYLLFVHTNQSGVGRGFFTMEAVERCNRRMLELLELPHPGFQEICVAPEGPADPPVYRKPSPRFIDECVAKYDLQRSLCWMVGDRLCDVETGLNAGISAALVEPVSGRFEVPREVSRFSSLRAFAETVCGPRAAAPDGLSV